MAVAYDAVSNAAGAHAGLSNSGYPGNYVTSITFAHTCGGTATLLVAACSVNIYGPDGGVVTSITTSATYNGVAMTSVLGKLSSGSTSSYSEVFYLLNPTTGSAQNVVITSSAAAEFDAGSVSFTGAGSVANSTSNTGVSTNSTTLSVTSSTNDMVYLHAAHGDVISGAGGTGTQRWLLNTNGNTAGNNAIGITYPGAATVSASATSAASDSWAQIGFSIVASGGAAVAYDPAAQIIGQSKAIQTACQW